MTLTEATPLLPTRSEEEERRIQKQRRDEMKGYILMAASAAGFASGSACVKALAISGIPALEIVFARSILQLSLGLCGCLWYQASPLGPAPWTGIVRRWLLLRGTAGAIGNACFFYAVSVMPLGDATVVFFTGPIFSSLFAYWMLGEPYGWFDKVASLACMLGIVMVLQPSALFHITGQQDRMYGAASALVGAISGALAICVVRKVGRQVHAMVHVVYFGFVSMVGSSSSMIILGIPFKWPQSTREWVLMGLVGSFAYCGQVMLNRGLQLAPAGPGMLMRNLDVVIAFILGIWLFSEVPDLLSVLGACAIVGCTMAMGVHKWYKR